MSYIHTLKRIRERKTNYHKRSSLLLSKKRFITIKVTNQNILTQVLEPSITGDKVITSAHSTNLAKLGWKGSLNSLPACYLTGLLLGKKASFRGIENAILYTGKDAFTERLSSCLKGIIDGGIEIPSSEDSFPSTERISGEHIANYASALKSDSETYNKRFSNIIKNGLNPENYKSHFEEFKEKIMNLEIQNFIKDKNNRIESNSKNRVEAEDNISKEST
ncbi:MAG TPA: 50S ribosomal protein L18 [Nitrososphaeraceae archaeon]|jgi:large subunit ribosomal protein L18|nr:50S ribosomal protein L18 [Nitrososphaeraceae archaeon]